MEWRGVEWIAVAQSEVADEVEWIEAKLEEY